MKKNIHPNYNTQVKVRCACGNEFITGSTKEKIYVEICSACHPFYTGKQKLVDTARRVEKFEERKAKTAQVSTQRKGKKAKRLAQQIKKNKQAQKTQNKTTKNEALKQISKTSKKSH